MIGSAFNCTIPEILVSLCPSCLSWCLNALYAALQRVTSIHSVALQVCRVIYDVVTPALALRLVSQTRKTV